MNADLEQRNQLIIGASGSGKSAFLRKTINFKCARIVAWDPDEDYPLPRVRSMAAFEKLVKKCGFGKIRVSLTVEPTEENFERWAGLVFAICHAAAPMEILADEIADVTRIAKASPKWGEMCRKVRKYGGRISAITQRPQEADKTIFNQTHIKWVGALSSAKAYKAMADEMDLTTSELKALDNIPRKQIQYWIREGTKPATKETIKF
ncbi:MAG: hypothetical protein COA78_36815 [Blastopirellula sp.]|nr:MAG: hypothetical protein COA78_36815 [Blastopirellula sp.]